MTLIIIYGGHCLCQKNCAKAKPKIMSHITFNKLFFNNDDMCRNFFLNVFHPLGLVCPECGCVHFTLLKCRNNVYTCSQCSHQVYLFAGTIFQDNKLPLYTLLYGIFLFITSTRVFPQKNCHVNWASTEKVLSCYAKNCVI